ncbi:MAG TPA: hypothetical protein EYP40_01980 [Chromatiales bacterium]|nr:hypothetical protein [Chromatiales bacterium]
MSSKPGFRQSLALFLGLLLPLGITTAEQLTEVQDWLQKMQRAAHILNYEGTFVYGQGSQLSTMRIIHRATPRGEQQRLIAMDGSGREVIRNAGKVICILPDRKAVVVEKSRTPKQFPPAFPIEIDRLAKYYRFTLDGTGKVAGRVTQRIDITPKDNYRYGHHLWVDRETGLLLKTHLVNEHGKRVEQFVFTEINYLDTIPDAMLKSGVDDEGFTWYEAKQDAANDKRSHFEGLQIDWLPGGFMEDMRVSKKLPDSVMPLKQLIFSDGLASVSVFIEEEIEHNPANLVGGTRMGAINVHGRSLGDYHVTVVGEVPHRTVRKISDSVRYQASHD